MSKHSNDEGRQARRRKLRVLVDYVSEQGVGCDYATDLSSGGLFLESEAPLAPGTVLKLRLRLPGGKQLHEIEGRVTRRRDASDGSSVDPPGMGVQFSDESAQKLARELEDLP